MTLFNKVERELKGTAIFTALKALFACILVCAAILIAVACTFGNV